MYDTLLYNTQNLSRCSINISVHTLLIPSNKKDVYNLGKVRDGTLARLGKEQNFKPEYASDLPVKIFKIRNAWEHPRPSLLGSLAGEPKYFLNAPQMIPMSSQAVWRKYQFSINKSQRIILSSLGQVGKVLGLDLTLDLASIM